jgi:hypothetical protein
MVKFGAGFACGLLTVVGLAWYLGRSGEPQGFSEGIVDLTKEELIIKYPDKRYIVEKMCELFELIILEQRHKRDMHFFCKYSTYFQNLDISVLMETLDKLRVDTQRKKEFHCQVINPAEKSDLSFRKDLKCFIKKTYLVDYLGSYAP